MKFFGNWPYSNRPAVSVDADHFDMEFDLRAAVTQATSETFRRKASGVAGDIAYLDNGAQLYETFKKSTLPDRDPAQSASARLITTHVSALAKEMEDSRRLIAIGGGSYDSFMNQDLVPIREALSSGKSALSELIIVDISDSFLKECRDAAEKVASDYGRTIDIRTVRADSKKIAGQGFDDILKSFKLAPRDQIKSTVITTGATFGNLDNIQTTDQIPYHAIEVQMARLGEFVGTGSTVMFDVFTQQARESYYNKPELAAFITNIPQIMLDHCNGLYDFKANGDSSREDETFFAYNLKNYWNARLIAHQLVATQPQQARIINGTEKGLTIEGLYNVKYSLAPHVEDITSRPSSNTGLDVLFHVSAKDLSMIVSRKIESDVSALHEGEDEYDQHHQVNPNVGSSAVLAMRHSPLVTSRPIFRGRLMNHIAAFGQA